MDTHPTALAEPDPNALVRPDGGLEGLAPYELAVFTGAHRSGDEDLAEAFDALIAEELFTA